MRQSSLNAVEIGEGAASCELGVAGPQQEGWLASSKRPATIHFATTLLRSTLAYNEPPGYRHERDFDKISLCTYSSGKVMVREVLEDWLQFLGEAEPGHIRSFTGK